MMTFKPASLLRTTAWAVVSLAASVASAQTPLKADPALGQQIAAGACSACHGADGQSMLSSNPRLAGQHAGYLVKQLNDFSKPANDKTARVSPIMSGFVVGLSAQDRANVAAWFAAQTPAVDTAKNPDTLTLGEQIYRGGLRDKAVPACTGCHGPNGAGIPSQYPRLAGQFAAYTETQLKAFRDGTRHNNAAMQEIAQRLSDKEIAAVADYVAGLR